MPLIIEWQDVCQTQTHHVDVIVFDAVLRVAYVGDVICDASWMIESESTKYTSNNTESMKRYLLDPNQHTLKLKFKGHRSGFYHRVWDALLEIPTGHTTSYSALAKKLGSGARAVAQACRDNPYAGFIPCHRVTAKSSIGGFMGNHDGEFVALKRRILMHEKSLAE